MTVYEKLLACRDEEFGAFQRKLVPNISPDTIIGVRTPQMRKIAKEVFGTEEGDSFIKKLPHTYYEENMVHFFMISLIRDFEECFRAVEEFLPFVDCWPVSDQSTPKVFKKNHEKLIPAVTRWIASNHVYTARFGLRMLMNEYLGEDFKEEYLELAASKTGEDYYLKMMVAWFFATALAKRYEESVVYLEQCRLDPWVHKKTIQKAVESFRVSEEHKNYLRTLKALQEP